MNAFTYVQAMNCTYTQHGKGNFLIGEYLPKFINIYFSHNYIKHPRLHYFVNKKLLKQALRYRYLLKLCVWLKPLCDQAGQLVKLSFSRLRTTECSDS